SSSQSATLFGISSARTAFDDAASAAGIPTDFRTRLDSRQELAAPLKIGFVDATPYIVGRVTGYDDDFQEFSGEDDKIRLFGGGGLRLHTSFHRTYDDVESKLLDIHRLRHILEPSVHVFWGGATLDSTDLPTIDPDVERIEEGLAIRANIRNTLQTQRGGPGQWRSVDWLVWDNEVVLRSDDADVTRRVPRFFDHRPELSRGGDQFNSRLMWMVTDALAMTGQGIWSLERDQMEQWSIGLNLRHSSRLNTWIEYRDLDVFDSRIFRTGVNYQMTPRYRLGVNWSYDFRTDDTRSLDVELQRRMPQAVLAIRAGLDDLEDEDIFSVSFTPIGVAGTRNRQFDDYFAND
ncbi:MAG: hypothetical protein R3336_05030, partial [Phycisphaeraceae bacterium]|nr:hypothetical protein [Phycisphaeraceae bacterium]